MKAVVVSGFPRSGKTSIIGALAQAGFAIVPEPASRLIHRVEERGAAGPLPWTDPRAFAQEAKALAYRDLLMAQNHGTGTIFFDGSMIDAASKLSFVDRCAIKAEENSLRYCPKVFLLPPWLELFQSNADGWPDFDTALADYARLKQDYAALGYRVSEVPKASIMDRVTFIRTALGV